MNHQAISWVFRKREAKLARGLRSQTIYQNVDALIIIIAIILRTYYARRTVLNVHNNGRIHSNSKRVHRVVPKLLFYPGSALVSANYRLYPAGSHHSHDRFGRSLVLRSSRVPTSRRISEYGEQHQGLSGLLLVNDSRHIALARLCLKSSKTPPSTNEKIYRWTGDCLEGRLFQRETTIRQDLHESRLSGRPLPDCLADSTYHNVDAASEPTITAGYAFLHRYL